MMNNGIVLPRHRKMLDDAKRQISRSKEVTMRQLPDLLTEEERKEILADAEDLWRALESNNLGGYSGQNRSFYILHAFKAAIEKYGRRDVGLTWSNDELDATRSSLLQKDRPE